MTAITSKHFENKISVKKFWLTLCLGLILWIPITNNKKYVLCPRTCCKLRHTSHNGISKFLVDNGFLLESRGKGGRQEFTKPERFDQDLIGPLVLEGLTGMDFMLFDSVSVEQKSGSERATREGDGQPQSGLVPHAIVGNFFHGEPLGNHLYHEKYSLSNCCCLV